MSNRLVTAQVAAAFLVIASPAQAQDETISQIAEIGYILNSFMFLVLGVLVMLMAVGFAMLEAGFVRRKNVTMQLTKNFGLLAVASALFYVVGYHLLKADGNWMVDGIVGEFAITALEPVNLEGLTPELGQHASGADFFFQLMFCAAAASIVSGSLAERVRLWPFLVYIAILTGLIYPIQAAWVGDGGFLNELLGFKDFAGATFVHSVGGWAALAGTLIVGARRGKYRPDGRIVPIPPSNLTLAALGTFFLWLGWFGFNGGSLLFMDKAGHIADISRIFVNTNMAAAGGAIAALILTQAMFRSVDLTLVLNGTLAGLVAITAEPLMPSMGTAFAIGAVGGAIVVFAIPALERLGVDDVVGAIPVHLGAGMWGTMAVVLSNPEATVGGQFAGIIIIGGAVLMASLITWFFLAKTVGVRVSEEAEIDGLDIHVLGMEAYPEFGDPDTA